MGAAVLQTVAGAAKWGQGLYNSVVKGETPQPQAPAPPPDQPNPENSAAALDEAARKQRLQSQGTKTVYAPPSGGASGGGGGLLSSGATASRMMLGS